MSRILGTDNKNGAESAGNINPIFVQDICYTNTSAKFWYGLLEEITNDFPGCTGIELSSSASDRLNSELLFPEKSLEHDLERFLFADIEAEMQKTVAELEILGPPSSVHIRLMSQTIEIISRDLPLDIIDSEIFSCLIVWPLKWAGIQESGWNELLVEGKFRLEERKQGRAYEVSFLLEKQPLSEGLFRRIFRMQHLLL